MTSCATLEDLQLPGAEQPGATPAVKVGDTVEVTTHAGEKRRFKVTTVEADAVAGKGVRVAYSDMTSLQRVHGVAENTTKTTLIVVGCLLVVGALALAHGGGGIPEGY